VGAAALDGHIFAGPYDARCVLDFDVASGATRAISTAEIHPGGFAWAGAVQFDGRIYFAPYDAESVLVVEGATGAVRGINTASVHTGSCKWLGAVEVNGVLYFAASSAPCILVLDAATEVVSGICTESICQGHYKWFASVELDGFIYFAPRQAPCILHLEVGTGSLHTIGKEPPSGVWWGAATYGARVYFFPFKGTDCIMDVESPSSARIVTLSAVAAESGPSTILCTGVNGAELAAIKLDGVDEQLTLGGLSELVVQRLGSHVQIVLPSGTLLQDFDRTLFVSDVIA